MIESRFLILFEPYFFVDNLCFWYNYCCNKLIEKIAKKYF